MGLIGSIIGGAASAAGALFSARGARDADAMYADRMRQIKEHRDNLYYRDPTQSAGNQAALSEARELMTEEGKRAAGAAAVTGGTDESVALAKKQGSQVVGNMLQQQAVQGEQQRENAWNNADAQMNDFTKYRAAAKQAQAQQIAQAAGGLAGAAGSLPI